MEKIIWKIVESLHNTYKKKSKEVIFLEPIEEISIEELDQFCITNQNLLQEYIKTLDNLKTNRISKK